MLTMPSFKKSLIVEQFQGNYLKADKTTASKMSVVDLLICRIILGLYYFSGEYQLQNLAVSLSNLKTLIKHSFLLYFLYLLMSF